jgi:hypothetical protein
MLVRHPRAIRWRQLIPALLAPSLLAAALALPLGGGYLWLALPVVYVAAVLAGAAHAAATRDKWTAAGWLVGTFITIHVTWSVGFWASLASVGVSRHEVNA